MATLPRADAIDAADAPTSMPLVSVVILTWNRRADLRESLDHVRCCGYRPLEVIVCDNGSTDGTPEMIRTHFPEVVLLEMPGNIGVDAYNAGFRRASGEYVVILDDDSWPVEGAIGRMVSHFADDPRLGIVAFDVRNAARRTDAATTPHASGEAVVHRYLMAFNGAGAGIRRSVFEQVGYYPAEFFLYWNEQDLSLRALDAGWSIASFTDVVGLHKYSPVNRESWRAPFYYCRNAFWLTWKHYPLARALAMTVQLGELVVRHSIEQRTTIYLQATWSALRGAFTAARARRPVRPEVAERFRVPLELSFTYYR